ncbi:MAG: AzlC family ABC transporter permease [Lachnospiraceae bacterium]|nr:AzlC family ABC transporter permease [Lachnospiraceae bacterium]
MNKDFLEGAKDSVPIAVGYFSVSFTFGIMAAGYGISPLTAGMISLTNVTSAGQFAGLTLMMANASYIEMFLTQLVINLRYALMSLSLTQKLAPNMNTPRRLLTSYAVTDEIFAVAVTKDKPLTLPYMLGLEWIPILSWTAGTIAGGIANNLLPASVQSALGLALYGMFVAIVLPPMRESRAVFYVALIALLFSCLFYYVPLFAKVSSGFSIIISTLLAAGAGALLFPREEPSEADDPKPAEGGALR